LVKLYYIGPPEEDLYGSTIKTYKSVGWHYSKADWEKDNKKKEKEFDDDIWPFFFTEVFFQSKMFGFEFEFIDLIKDIMKTENIDQVYFTGETLKIKDFEQRLTIEFEKEKKWKYHLYIILKCGKI